MKAVFGRDVNEAVHQEDADEVTHLLPAWVGRAKQGGLPHHLTTFFDTLYTHSALYEKMEAEYHFCKFLANGAIKCLLGIFLSCTENVWYSPQKSHLWGFKGENSTGQRSEEIRGGPERILREQTVHQAEKLHHTTWVMDFPAICTFCYRLIREIQICTQHEKTLIYWYCINDYAMG